MTERIKAIQTRAFGCYFRSRLEARWATFFNTMGWSWEYEPEGFELESGRYLPDFKVQESNHVLTWFEVKPFMNGCPDDQRWTELAVGSGIRMITAYGMHRSGDGCEIAWINRVMHPHAGRLTLPNGNKYELGPFWTELRFYDAWNAASEARFERN